ncbi:MAG: methyltransferase [Candidatus Entotheonellia bacterium]
MDQRPSTDVKRPRADDRPVWDVVFGVYGYPAILLAHKLKLFPLLADQPRTLLQICGALGIKRRPAEAILIAAVALEFLSLRDGHYSLTPLAEDYLLDRSPTYFGTYFDLIINNYSVCSLDKLETAVRTDTAQVYAGGQEMFTSHAEQAELARFFTRTMHSTSMAPALAWPEVVDLSKRRVLLDIGGGSGAHSIGAALKFPHLRAIVFDAAPVCEVAAEFIAGYGLQTRMGTHVGDMWTDPFPSADVHFYSFIYHDWTPEKCRLLTRKSFESLQPGGQILIHEMLYNDEKTGPFPIAAFSMIMLGWTEGEQYSRKELSEMLREAGFTHIEVRPTFGYWSIVTALKP